MAKIPKNKETEAYLDKTIQPGNWFIVRFLGNSMLKPEQQNLNDALTSIKTYWVSSIQVQEPVKFDKTGYQKQGRPFARPVMKTNDGYEFTVRMEETVDWDIQKLIDELEKRNINPDGTHTGLITSNLGVIEVSSLSPRGYIGTSKTAEWSTNMTWRFEDCFFVGADNIDFSYDSAKKITRDLTFCCSRITRKYIENGTDDKRRT